MVHFRRKFLKCIYFILLLLPTIQIYAQETGFEQAKIKQIKEYKSIQLDNGLTLILLNNKDTNNYFIRSFTNLPDYVSKNFRPAMAVENELRQSGQLSLPSGWTDDGLDELKIKLVKDKNGYFATCPSKSLDTTLFLFSDLFQIPVIDNGSIEKAKSIILAGEDSLMHLPSDKIDKITKSIIYGKDHPILKHFSEAEINSVNKETYLDFYNRFYKPNNSFLLVIGGISLDSIKTLANIPLGGWKKKDIPASDYKLIPIEEPKIVFFDTLISGRTDIKILFPFALHPFTFDSEKAELLSTLFQDVLSSKLIQNQQLANNIYAKFESDKITGNYQLKVELAKDSINLAINAIIETISEFKNGKFPDEKLSEAKKQIISQFKSNKTDNAYISQLIINTERNNLPKTYYADFVDEIEKTDKTGIQNFTAKYLNYNTALFQIPGHWYQSLNDFIKLSKNFNIELYELDGNLIKLIPKGFNGFSVIDNYIEAIGGEQNIKKIKEISIKYGAIYELKDDEQLFVEGIMLHKADDKFYSESHLIRPKKDTLFIQIEIYNGIQGMDSTRQEKKILQGIPLELLKYKSPLVPEIKYKEWLYHAKLVRSDTIDGNYVWVVVMDNPAKQQITDYYDVDKGIRYKRIIKDQQFFNERTILYSRYQKENENGLLYPHLKIIYTPETTIRMLIRELDYESKASKKLFDFND
jgi:predicted Zn-dependent peptidase